MLIAHYKCTRQNNLISRPQGRTQSLSYTVVKYKLLIVLLASEFWGREKN